MMVKESMSTQPANPSIASLCHCLISVCHLALLQCSGNVFFGMFQLTATFTNEILTKGEIKRFSPLRSEFRNLSFLITTDDISGFEEQKGDCICWQEEKKEMYTRYDTFAISFKHWRQEMFELKCSWQMSGCVFFITTCNACI